MAATLENLIPLIQNREFHISGENSEDPFYDDWPEPDDKIRAQDVISFLQCHQGICSSPSKLLELLEHFKAQDGLSISMWLRGSQDAPCYRFGGTDENPIMDDTTDFHLKFKKSFVESMCNMFHQPFVQLNGTITEARDNDPVTVVKRFDLSKMLKTDNELPEEHFTALNKYYGRTFTYSISVGWNEVEEINAIIINSVKIPVDSIMQKLFEGEDATKDLTIVSGGGAEVKCHRIIFAAHSSVFSAMMTNGMRECLEGRIEMEANSEDGLRHLIRYLYGMELIVDEIGFAIALELFQLAHQYELTYLEESFQEIFLQRGIEWFTPDGALRLYFYVRNLEVFATLREHSLALLSGMDIDDMKATEGYKQLNPVDALELSFKLVQLLQTRLPK